MLSIPDMLTVYEGESQEICVTIQNTYVPRERDVVVEFRVYPIEGSMSKLLKSSNCYMHESHLYLLYSGE